MPRRNTLSYRNVPGASPHDESMVSYWRAKEQAGYADLVIVPPCRLGDDAHGTVLVYSCEDRPSPRYSDQTTARLGTFAFPTQPDARDMVKYHPTDGKVNWWMDYQSRYDHTGVLRWLDAKLKDGLDTDDFTARNNAVPTAEQLFESASAHYARTGEMAFPASVSDAKTNGPFVHVCRPPDVPASELKGDLCGLVILSPADLAALGDPTEEKAFAAVQNAVGLYNDWRSEEIIEAELVIYLNNHLKHPIKAQAGPVRADDLYEHSAKALAALWAEQ